MKTGLSVSMACLLAALAPPARAEIEMDRWGKQSIGFEGLLQFDYNRFNSDRVNLNGSASDGDDSDSDVRRAEFIVKGSSEKLAWVVGYDAKGDKFLDVDLKYKFAGASSLVLGQFKQPNSLEEMGSSRHNDFISKAMTTNLYAVGRRMGAALATGGASWTLTGSAFGREMTRNLAQGEGFGIRGTWTPYNDGAGHFLHLGLAMADYAAADAVADGRARVRVRPDADLAGARLIDAGQFTDADRIRTQGIETAWAKGPWKLQAEAMRSVVSRDAHADFTGNSGYVQAVWNLTGEAHGYKAGAITTAAPADPAKGMWQLGLRYDHADLDDGSVRGGKEGNLTAGVNVYWHSNFRLAFNYVMVSSEKGVIPLDDNPDIVEIRAQFFW